VSLPPSHPDRPSAPSATADSTINPTLTSPGSSMLPVRTTNETTNAATTSRLIAMCSNPVRNAAVERGIATRSSRPNSAAANAPRMPSPMSQNDPLANTSGSPDHREARSNTNDPIQVPMGTVTRIGWDG